MRRPPAGLIGLSAFFALGAVIAGVTGIALLFPGGGLEPMWRLNPEAQESLMTLGASGIALMFTVATACALAAIGLWIGARWGQRLALGVLAVNLAGDTVNAVIRGDLRTLIGLPIAGAMILYLLSPGTRNRLR